MTAAALSGCRVLVTRPAAQAENLLGAIKAEGGTAMSYPALAIAAAETDTATRCLAANSYDWLIFISRNAVDYALPYLPAAKTLNRARIAVIGQATAGALQAAGYQLDLVPENASNSEALLSEAVLQQCQQQRVLIIRGVGGRDLLKNTLTRRGAEVEYAEVYQRICPTFEKTVLAQYYAKGIDIITIASGETLTNLVSMAEASQVVDKLLATPLLVVSQRIQVIAQQLGFTDTVIVSETPTDKGIIAALQGWWQQANDDRQ